LSFFFDIHISTHTKKSIFKIIEPFLPLHIDSKKYDMMNSKETRPQYEVTNDFHKLDIGLKESLLMELMKKFIKDNRKIPKRLLSDLKQVKKENVKREGYTLHTDAKNTQTFLKIYYKQYKHLDKYYPEDIVPLRICSLQKGERALHIEKQFEHLIRTKGESHTWIYEACEDRLIWTNRHLLKYIKNEMTEEKKKCIEKVDFMIGDIKWYGLCMDNQKEGEMLLNHGITCLAREMIYGFVIVFDNVKSRNDFYDWFLK